MTSPRRMPLSYQSHGEDSLGALWVPPGTGEGSLGYMPAHPTAFAPIVTSGPMNLTPGVGGLASGFNSFHFPPPPGLPPNDTDTMCSSYPQLIPPWFLYNPIPAPYWPLGTGTLPPLPQLTEPAPPSPPSALPDSTAVQEHLEYSLLCTYTISTSIEESLAGIPLLTPSPDIAVTEDVPTPPYHWIRPIRIDRRVSPTRPRVYLYAQYRSRAAVDEAVWRLRTRLRFLDPSM